MKSKYPGDNEFESFVEKKRAEFDEMKDAVKTVADKINLDAQNNTLETDELAGFYTQMFNYVLKEKILTFMDVCIHDQLFDFIMFCIFFW